MANFTPGPWRADWDDNGSWYIEPLCVTGRGLRGGSGDCVESANARLIAQAPAMYKLAEMLVEANRTAKTDAGFIAKVALICEYAKGIIAAVDDHS